MRYPCFLILGALVLVACSMAEMTSPSPTPLPVATATLPLPPITSTSPPISPTILPLPTDTPTSSVTSTPAVPVPPDWSGEWDVYLSSPILSIVKTVKFQVPVGDSLDIRAEWTEGTRPVFFQGTLSEDRRTITGQFYN